MMSGFTHEPPASVNVDWYTPPWIFERMGLLFDLDPCQPVGGVPWIPTCKYYTEADDGLIQPWHGLVWCNPPYGKYTARWLKKMHEYRNGVSLVFARTDTAWFHDYVAKADAILFIKRRVSFVDGLGVAGGSSAGAGSMLVAWGAPSVAALESMSDLGLVIYL